MHGEARQRPARAGAQQPNLEHRQSDEAQERYAQGHREGAQHDLQLGALLDLCDLCRDCIFGVKAVLFTITGVADGDGYVPVRGLCLLPAHDGLDDLADLLLLLLVDRGRLHAPQDVLGGRLGAHGNHLLEAVESLRGKLAGEHPHDDVGCLRGVHPPKALVQDSQHGHEDDTVPGGHHVEKLLKPARALRLFRAAAADVAAVLRPGIGVEAHWLPIARLLIALRRGKAVEERGSLGSAGPGHSGGVGRVGPGYSGVLGVGLVQLRAQVLQVREHLPPAVLEGRRNWVDAGTLPVQEASGARQELEQGYLRATPVGDDHAQVLASNGYGEDLHRGHDDCRHDEEAAAEEERKDHVEGRMGHLACDGADILVVRRSGDGCLDRLLPELLFLRARLRNNERRLRNRPMRGPKRREGRLVGEQQNDWKDGGGNAEVAEQQPHEPQGAV
mmetsp:Transcript_17345/g.52286  ORF Transcript_17345/g.52286 Transcript_17345/m.52286 type:complete len:445 (+) Transcript_17345:145-1479(+)